MNNTEKLVLITGLALSFQACQPSSRDKTSGTTTIPADTALTAGSKNGVRSDSAGLAPEETAFLEKAAVGGMMEVELGNLTTQKTKNPKVLAFAKRMIADHTEANNDLKKLAGGMGIQLPGALPSAEQGHLAQMRQMQSEEYDENYMDMMVQDHAKTIDLFNGAAKFKNQQLSAFAVKTLPVLQLHNKMAIGIDSLYKDKKPDNKGDDLPNVDKKHKN